MLDGAMGTQLQLRGLTTEQKPELAAFIMPDVLTAVHRDYAHAGADILLANTFGANPRKLKGTGYTVQQVIEASIACAQTAAQETGALVALDIGPIGELLAPAGTLPFEDACAQFAEMVRAGAAAGADLVFLETMTDLYELKAAILAAKENCDLPVFTSMSFEAVPYLYRLHSGKLRHYRRRPWCGRRGHQLLAGPQGNPALCSAALPCGARRYAGVCQAQCGPAEPGRQL